MKYSSEQINRALLEVWDIFDRALCPFIALRDLSEQLRNKQIPHDLEVLHFGINQNSLTPEVMTVFKEWTKELRVDQPEGEIRPDKIQFSASGIPVSVKVIKQHYPVFDYPDTVTHLLEDFKVPNPFDKYWKQRFFIK